MMINKIKTKVRNLFPFAVVAVVAAVGSGCSEKTEPEASETTVDVSQSIRILDTNPADTISVGEARQTLQPGASVSLAGQIGGVEAPFFEGYAGFVLGDPEILFCDEMDEEHCPMPWDACCEDPDKLKSLRASVQFVDAQGLPVAKSLKGFAGLKELDHVVVTGTVAATSTPENLIIEADGLYVK